MQHQEKDTWLSNDCYNESKAIFRNLDTWVRDMNLGFSGDWDSKEAACNAGVTGLFPGLGRSSGERNGNPLQYSCLENPMNRGVLWATVCEVARVGARVGHDLVTTITTSSFHHIFFNSLWTKVTWVSGLYSLFVPH